MLYHTPFPTTPQNDLPRKAERNAEIHSRYADVETAGDLARDYNLSEQRISQIIHQQRS
jgi:Mor family transcriptional regulator